MSKIKPWWAVRSVNEAKEILVILYGIAGHVFLGASFFGGIMLISLMESTKDPRVWALMILLGAVIGMVLYMFKTMMRPERTSASIYMSTYYSSQSVLARAQGKELVSIDRGGMSYSYSTENGESQQEAEESFKDIVTLSAPVHATTSGHLNDSDVDEINRRVTRILLTGAKPSEMSGPLSTDSILSAARNRSMELVEKHHHEIVGLADRYRKTDSVNVNEVDYFILDASHSKRAS